VPTFALGLVSVVVLVVSFSLGLFFISCFGSTVGLPLELSFSLGLTSGFFSSGFFSSGFFSSGFFSSFFSSPFSSNFFCFKSKYFLINLGKSLPEVAAFPKHCKK